ncbi:flap endonuclease GEN homolog 1 isoform X1 [Sphaerodactylus townsendi]|uniref:flap endonuclease GEN homolog 1 isoform X1 n=1 Tax=Sphaerodactylus townsendi TaxID=933632 RepID=UPI00202615A1|nr:flap endonuclease GEN homolog 1 isoform X1 [Sphaerodactylus townsendi]XP_048354884.1 flap endonuclease GEN homolog 1 isoform X1 [Sphaerodactylus townsendi]XP_048354893.1 flap endonuclease GEN homolog 1 isoform X1 [Sphaerodactylus townsendi]
MGVTGLWQILEPVKQHIPLSHLTGKTLAVDLSIWVCEAQSVKKMTGVVTKPHLRNIFFRVSSLTLMGIHLVFVMEGDAPKLKADTMSKRSKMRFGPSNKPGAARQGRSHFRFFLKECLEMLECLGIPWVQAAGEAEAMCAYLNANGYVDGCITNDGDAFLYGAQTVYRNFTMNIKDPHVDCYSVSSIEETLGCNRECLIGLAILLGCDYLPKGVPGVGKEQALKLIQALEGQSLLQRFEQWKDPFQHIDIPLKKMIHCTVCRHPGSFKDHKEFGCQLCESVEFCKPHEVTYLCPCDWHRSEQDRQVRIVEESIKKKTKACEGFPFPEVIQEYLVSKDKLMKPYECRRPNLLYFQRFASEKMDWPKHYACEKLCALLTYYDMNRRKAGHTDPWQLQALRIVKTRTKNGISCFEIEWQKPEHYATADDQPVEPFLKTVEESSLFQAAYPEIVAMYQMEKLEICKEKKKGTKAKLKKKEDLAGDGNVADLLSQLSLQSSCEILPNYNHKSDFKSDCQTLAKTDSNSQVLFVSASSSAKTLPSQNPPSPLLVTLSQNTGNECNSDGYLSSQVEFTSSSVVSGASSVIADLQLSGIDWKGTSFTVSPAHISDSCLESEWCVCCNSTEQYPLLYCRSAEIIPPFSNSVHQNQNPPSSRNWSVSGSDLPEGQHCLLSKEQVNLKLSALKSISKDPKVPLLSPLQMTEHTKGTSSPEGEFSNVSAQQNDSLQGTEKMLPKKHPREFNLGNNTKLLKQSKCLSQNNAGLSTSRSVSLCTENIETTDFGHKPLTLRAKSTEDLDNCQARKESIKMNMKNSLKSVCQSGYYSSEDSDGGNVHGGRRAPRDPRWRKKCHLVPLKEEKKHVKRSETKPELEVKQRGKVCDTDLSVAEYSKPATVVHVHASPVPIDASVPHLRESGADVRVDSPLPLSERLKLRLQSH